MLGSCTYLRQALDARLGETADDSQQMPGMKALIQGLMILLELLSSADFVTDILLVRWMYLSHHVWWATLSCLMMVAPYLAAFSATLRISLRNRIFEATDSCGRTQSFYRFRQLAAAVCMTPLCVAAFILLDLVYSIKAATFDILALFIGLVKPGMTLDVTGGFVSKFLSDHLGLTTMDIEGYRRLRTTTQLLFESFPQIVLQLHILLQSSEREFQVSDEELVVSLAFALFHLLATCYIVWLEAKSAGESFIRYTMTCLTGRLGWLPLADSAALTGQNEDADSRKMHFDDLSVVSGCGRFTMAFEFSQSTWAKLVGVLSKVQDKADNIHVAFGPSIALMSIYDISTFQKQFPKVQVSMRSGKEPVPWTRILQNSGFILDKSGKVTIGAEQQATAQRLLEDFISNHNHEAVHALLEADVCVTGLTSGGLLYLTFAVEMSDAGICDLLLSFNAPLTSEKEISDPLGEWGYRVRSTLETPLEAAFRIAKPDVISAFMFHERIQATSSMRKRVLEFAANARREDRLEDAKKFARASGLSSDGEMEAASKEAKIFLGVHGGKSSESFQCRIADLERLDLFREKILAVELRETLEKKKVLIEEDGHLSIDLTFVAQMFPNSALSGAHLQQLLAIARDGLQALPPTARQLGVLDSLADEFGLVDMQRYIQLTAPHRVVRTVQFQQGPRQSTSYSRPREGRAMVLVDATLPGDCWRVSTMRISGLWEDQGWGNTGIHKVEVRATTQRAGLVYVQIHTVHWEEDDGRHIEVNLQLGKQEGSKHVDAEEGNSLLEVLTGHDQIQITMPCVGWSGHEASAENTRVEIDYFKIH